MTNVSLALGRSLQGNPPAPDLRQLGGQGIHPRGNFNGFTGTPSKQKWLEVHGDSHWSLFYSAYGLDLQKRFFDHFLKGMDNGWDKQPPVQLNIRHPGEKFVLRMEKEWPLARTRWTKFYLDPAGMTLSPKPVAREGKVEYEALGKESPFGWPRWRRRPRSPGHWPPSFSSRRRPGTPTSSSSCGSSTRRVRN